MKKILPIIIILLFSFSTNAQFNRYEKAKIYLKDGSIKTGFAKIIFLDNKIKFKKNKKDSPEILSYLHLDKFIIDDVEYDYKITNKNSTIKIFRVEQRGKVSLYYKIKSNPGVGMPMGNLGAVNISYSISTTSNIYYLGKNDSDMLTPFKTRKKIFNKITTQFFSDCPSLLDKIDSKRFKKREIVDIVNHYNHNCN